MIFRVCFVSDLELRGVAHIVEALDTHSAVNQLFREDAARQIGKVGLGDPVVVSWIDSVTRQVFVRGFFVTTAPDGKLCATGW